MNTLPADFNTALDMASTTTAGATTALPPTLAEARTLTFDETLASLNRTPFFMTDLSSASEEENPALEALKALAYEGTKVEVAANFREQGNECAREKKWSDAREFYGKALVVLRDGLPVPKDGQESRGEMNLGGEGEEDEVVDVEDEERKGKDIQEACLVNRALCNLELKNYGLSTRDCLTALSLFPTNIKALYRLALSLHHLSKHTDAVSTLNRLLCLQPTNTVAQNLLNTVTAALARSEATERDRSARIERVAAEAATLRQALKQRGIVCTETGKGRPADAEDAVLSLQDPVDAKSELKIPVLLLYPTHAQSDFIKGVSENETLAMHLEYVLEEGAVPWDEEREFTGGGAGGVGGEKVDCFMETIEGGLVKVGKKIKLGKVLGGGKVDVKDGICRVFVVPRGRIDAWIEEFKKRKGRG